MNVYVFLEIPYDNSQINIYTTKSQDYEVDILKNFKFNSNKSLILFLEKYKNDILEGIPHTEEKILDSLETQKYLSYINVKWYNQANDILLTPDEILDIALKYKCISKKLIVKYIIDSEDIDYTYDLQLSKVNG